MKSHDVRFWEIRPNKSVKNGKTVVRSYTVRWTVAGREKSKTFERKALAVRFLGSLVQAANQGEPFDVETGLPESLLRKERPTLTWYAVVRKFVSANWARQPAKTRSSIVDALATITPALVTAEKSKPDASLLRAALVRYALHPPSHEGDVPAELVDPLRWLERHSLPVTELAKAENVRRALDAVAVTMEGRRAAATTIARKRAVFHSVLKYVVRELKLLDSNPLHDVDWSAPEIRKRVDPRVVPNPAQARQLLSATTYVGRLNGRGRRLMPLFACMYYAALRPGEAVGLRVTDCHLPEEGWGRLTVVKNRPQAGKRYTDSGESHDDKGTKRRGEDEVRPIPIPPVLVRILRDHVKEFGTAPDGRLFATSTGKLVASSSYWRVWDQARMIGLSPEQAASPLAHRPYDLRHAAITTWLNAGVPAPEIARRVGHSEEVLWKVYAGCLDGDEMRINRLIETALAA
ncbi:tyrosine-type recombinase/integrase [Actinoallomurus rhizosphaericola]|uniref:tyrosine-type recombinase/integrase n=1 Tax=Actinoallomurus rhizosphaericola TaxID=2952536 RepID=UPI002091B494|nr:tyrosine-type recombinase/integrase [Actinoallomurus rhizosphaericola]MCO5993017.1 tyrosine-type recombinase/integrase [Actinoallomurus rhizosphaericola]